MNKKIAVLRTLGVRISQAEFAKAFRRLDPVLMGDLNPEVISYAKKVGLAYKDIPLKPAYFVDPVKLIFGRTTHQSWVGPDPKRLAAALAEVDVIEIYETYFFYCRWAAEIAKRQKKPLVCETFTSFPHPARFIPPYSLNIKKVVGQTDLFIVRSKRVFDFLKLLKVPEHKTKLIYPGINLKRFFPAKREVRERVNILFVGALNENKGFDDLISVFPELVKTCKRKIQLLVRGNGPLEERVLQMAKSLPIEYYKEVSYLDIPKIYRRADIFCGPSKDIYSFGIKRAEEGFGFVFMEALASGLPIVATQCGAIPEVVGADNALVKQGDREDLKRALYDYIFDDKKRLEIGKKNRERATQLFDLSRQVALTEKEMMTRLL